MNGVWQCLTAGWQYVTALDWHYFATLAPLATAFIALVAALTALRSMYVQRDTARRRAAIDFFLKTETDKLLIDGFNNFEDYVAGAQAMADDPALTPDNPKLRAIRMWLNLCELIAVGVNLKAFSHKVSFDYWGYILPEAFDKSLPLIKKIRSDRAFGGPDTFCELEKLAKKWKKKRK